MRAEIEEFVNQYETVRRWVDNLRTPRTKEYFPKLLMRFCDWVEKDPDELIRERREQSRSANEEEKFKQEYLVEHYITELESKKMKRPVKGRITYSPSYIRINANAIRSFYRHNRANLHLIKRLESYNVWDTDAASKEQIQAMYNIADAKERAMLLFQYHSGLRNDTIAKLTLGDIGRRTPISSKIFLDPEQAPVVIQIPPEKAKERPSHYRSFLSKEVIEALNVYLELRKQGKVARGAKPENLTPSSPVFRATLAKKIKPMTPSAISTVISRLAKRAGFLNVTSHSLRRSFQTTSESAGVPPNWIKLMMGHKLPGVEGSYSKPSIEQLRKAYKEKAEPALSIGEAKPVLTSGEIEELVEKRMKEFERRMITSFAASLPPELRKKFIVGLEEEREK